MWCRNNNVTDSSVAEQASINKDNVDKEAEITICDDGGNENNDYSVKPQMLQTGVLRTNCIDCLDRTNVAQFAYGLVALARQLQVLGFIESPYIDLDNPLVEELMAVYESMGDTLALQYGGSAAHNKVISIVTTHYWHVWCELSTCSHVIKKFGSSTCFLLLSLFLARYHPTCSPIQ